jgi:hypothetical protein
VAPATFNQLLERLRDAVQTIQSVVRETEPGSVSGDQARAVVDLLAEGERATSSGIALLTPVVVETGAYAKEGHGNAVEWLGSVSGTSAGVAKGRLAAAERATSDPSLTAALHEGDLSAAQLKLITDAAAAAPGSVGDLLELAGGGASLRQLNDAAAQLRAAARSREAERLRRERVHTRRHVRWHQSSEGGIRGEFSCDEVAWARVAPRLEAEARERWKRAGNRETLEAHRLDAFIDILVGCLPGTAGPSTRPHTLVVIDAEALRRGTVLGDETCEIDGIGPVSVDAARELIGEGGMQLLVRDGVDIRTVTSTRRALPQRVEAALIVRDRTCVIKNCGKRHGLQADHCRIDYRDDGPTCLDNLARLCAEHHDLKTYGGWRLAGGPGRWDWIAPAHPKSARYIARARKLAAAKARAAAGRNVERNLPRQT